MGTSKVATNSSSTQSCAGRDQHAGSIGRLDAALKAA